MSGLARRSLLLSSSALAAALFSAAPAFAQSSAASVSPAVQTDVHPITSLPRPRVPAGNVLVASAVVPAAPVPAVKAPVVAPTAVFAPAVTDATPVYSSSAPTAVVLPAPALHATMAVAAPPPPAPSPDRIVRPFSTVAIGVKLGLAGVGFDVAVPLAQRLNLRGGASFFQYHDNDNLDGQQISGDLKFRSVNASVDIFPFNNRFRISPGVILYNGNHLSASSIVPGNQSFDLGDQTYISNPNDPVHGSADFTFGNRIAPSLTIGAGNMIPRHSGKHWSIPFEIGAEFISKPALTLNLQGSACQQTVGNILVCQSTSQPQVQANIQQEQKEINDDIAPLRFFPILSIGVAYKF